MAGKTEAVAHTDIVPSTTIAYKIGGRWYWVIEVERDHDLSSGSFFVRTVPVGKDPRYPQIGLRSVLRYVGSYSTVLMRAQTAPVFDWVTRKIENQERWAAYKAGELALTDTEARELHRLVGTY